DSADVLMRMYNPDGTPDVCGNGMRCVARYEFEKRRTRNEKRNLQQAAFAPTTQRPNDPTTLTIETIAGIRRAQMADSESAVWTVDMGEPRFEPTEIPMLVDVPRVMDFPLEILGDRIPVTALSTGTAHSVVFVEELPEDEQFLRLSP